MPAARTLHDVSTRGVRMRVAQVGEGPPIVLLHDYLLGHTSFDDLADALAPTMRVLVPDLPGFGESEKPTPARFDYSVEAYVAAIVDMLAALHLGRVVVLGHGMGGAVALALAADHPELAERLVLESALLYPARPDRFTRLSLMPLLGPFVFKQVVGRAAFRAYLRARYYGGREDVPSARLDVHYANFQPPAARESAYAVQRSLLDTRNVVARVPRVSTPTLVLAGRSAVTTPAAQGQKLARELASARLELFDTADTPHEEAPLEVARAVVRFLERGTP